MVMAANLLFAHSIHAQNVIQLELPLIVNQTLSGNMSAKITDTIVAHDKSTNVTVEKVRLKQLLSGYAEENQIKTWLGEVSAGKKTLAGSQGGVSISAFKRNATASDAANDNDALSQDFEQNSSSSTGLISLATLRRNGLDINFTPSLLTIDATIQYVGIRPISLRGRRLANPADAYGPSKFSSGMNVAVSNSYIHRSAQEANEGFDDTRVAFDGFTNVGGFGGWSLFYEGDYLEGQEQEFSRGDITLIHDSYKRGVRYAFGDVRPTVSNLQTTPNLFGINIERSYREVNPSKNIRPSGRATFTLDRPSRVQFEVNGVIVSTQDLDAGDYSVKDFPFAFGANSVRVIVDDGISNVEVANFTAFSDLELLAPGLSNFGISAGFQRSNGAGRSRRYEDDPVALGFYERGLTQNLTIGVQAEVSEDHALIGSTAAYGTRSGLISAELAFSRRQGFDTAFSSSLGYGTDFSFKSGWTLNTNFQVDYQSSDFGDVTTVGNTDRSWSVLSSLSASKGGYALIATGSRITTGELVTNSFSLGLSKTFKLFDFGINYNFSQTDDFEAFNDFSFNISGRFGGGTLRGQYQSSNEQSELVWNGYSRSGAGKASLNRISLVDNVLVRSAQVDARYVGSKFLFDVDHVESQSQLLAANDGSRTNFRFGSSIGFAGGHFAFGRPFNDGFIITEAHQNLRGKRVSVKRSSRNGDLITTSKYLRSTLVPLNGSYREQRYVIGVDDLPLGYDIGSGELEVFPGFLAGYHYKVGSDSANTAIGKVMWPDNSPPSLIVGKIIPKNGGKEITIFTNKTGRFVAERIPDGKYSIVFNDGYDDFSAEIEIEKGDEPGLVKLDTITLEKVQ